MTLQHSQRGYQRADDRRPPQLPREYVDTMRDGYFDSSNNLKAALITTLADQVAKDFVSRGQITTAQLRNFFGHVRGVQRELEQSDFPSVVPKILVLMPLAAYYVGRGSNQYERGQRNLLKQFIDLNVEWAKKGEMEFKKGFVMHFQCVVAFHKHHSQR